MNDRSTLKHVSPRLLRSNVFFTPDSICLALTNGPKFVKLKNTHYAHVMYAVKSGYLPNNAVVVSRAYFSTKLCTYASMASKLESRFALRPKDDAVPHNFLKMHEKESWMAFFNSNFKSSFLKSISADFTSDTVAKENSTLYFIYRQNLAKKDMNFRPANMSRPNYNLSVTINVTVIKTHDYAIKMLCSGATSDEYNNFLFASYVVNGPGPIVYVKNQSV